MIRSKASALGTKIQLVLAVMLAVVASMTLHHGAMAEGSELDRHHIGLTSHHGDHSCTADCTPADHSMPVCCGLGLCLSGMPVDPSDLLPEVSDTSLFGRVAPAAPFWMYERIDRPPKVSPKA
jgi:hypothetical protein